MTNKQEILTMVWFEWLWGWLFEHTQRGHNSIEKKSFAYYSNLSYYKISAKELRGYIKKISENREVPG